MSKPRNGREALASILLARGRGVPHAWQVLRVSSPTLAGYLEGLGEAGWPAVGQAVNDLRKDAVLAFEELLREEAARHRRDAREAWEAVKGAGGAANGGDALYLSEVCPTAAARLTVSMVDADAREEACWFPWTKKAARAAAWAWTAGYLDRGYQQPGSGILSWADDFDHDTRARVAHEHPRKAYATTLEGAAAAWACQWAEKNGLITTKEEDMPWEHETRPQTALAILAGINKWETKNKVGGLPPTLDTFPPIGDSPKEEEEFSDLFEEA